MRESRGLPPTAALGCRTDYRERMRLLKEEHEEAQGCVELPELDDSDVTVSGFSYDDRIGATLFNASTRDSPIDPVLFEKSAQGPAGRLSGHRGRR